MGRILSSTAVVSLVFLVSACAEAPPLARLSQASFQPVWECEEDSDDVCYDDYWGLGEDDEEPESDTEDYEDYWGLEDYEDYWGLEDDEDYEDYWGLEDYEDYDDYWGLGDDDEEPEEAVPLEDYDEYWGLEEPEEPESYDGEDDECPDGQKWDDEHGACYPDGADVCDDGSYCAESVCDYATEEEILQGHDPIRCVPGTLA